MCEDAIGLLLGGMSTADVARAIDRNVRNVKPGIQYTINNK